MPGRLPTTGDFPENLKLTIVPPPSDDPPTNVLILLHGLGDKKDAFAQLSRQMRLPETACISIEGPQTLLDLNGFHWGDDIIFDSTSGGLDADAGFKRTTELLKTVVNHVIFDKCGYRRREVMLFGFGQGGMAALNLALTVYQDSKRPADGELGGVISIGGPLPDDAPPSHSNKCTTPVLVCAGNDQTSFTPTGEDKLKRSFEYVEVKRYRRPGDSMPSNRDEMMPVMHFFSRRLKSRKGVPEGSVDIT